ncbi:hypothetical protein RA277_27990, partial [Pseudomonas syringae pv. tagetis]
MLVALVVGVWVGVVGFWGLFWVGCWGGGGWWFGGVCWLGCGVCGFWWLLGVLVWGFVLLWFVVFLGCRFLLLFWVVGLWFGWVLGWGVWLVLPAFTALVILLMGFGVMS